MMFLSQFAPSEKNATSVAIDALRALCLWICRFVYKLIAFFYELFMNMTRIEILQQPEIEKLYKRVTILLGLIMLFVSIFFLLKMLLNPDKINDKEQGMGSLVKRIIIVILMLGFVPSIFTMANELQKKVITSDIIPKILLGKTFTSGGDSSDTSAFAQNYGRRLSANLFTTFYYKNEDIISEDEECAVYDFIEQEMAQYGTIETAVSCVNNKGTATGEMGGANTKAYVIEYDSLGSVFVGIAVLWMIIVYTINVGVRIIQFTFLQVIAPIPIISYVYPQKDGMFQKWVRQSITTYLDLFIRLGVIYFVFYLTDLIFNSAVLSGFNENNVRWLQIILILALLVFAKRLPKLLQEMAGKPNAASIGYDPKFGVAAGIVGGAAIGMIGSGGSPIHAISGAIAGGKAGNAQGGLSKNWAHAKKEIRGSNLRHNALRMQGYNPVQRFLGERTMGMGMFTRGEKLEYKNGVFDKAKSLIDDEDGVKDMSILESTAQQYGVDQALTYYKGTKYKDQNGQLQSCVETRTDAQGNEYEVIHDRNGKILWDTSTQGAIDMNAIKSMKTKAADYVINDPNASASIKNALAQAKRYGWDGQGYSSLKAIRNKTKAEMIRFQRMFGAGGPPPFVK